MTNADQGFVINDRTFFWGESFQLVRDLVTVHEEYEASGRGWQLMRVKGTTMCGLGCTEIEIAAPFEDRPVMQVRYYLAPLPPASEGDLHSAYVKMLEPHFGAAKKKEYHYNSNIYKGKIASSGVVFTCNWDTEEVHIGLSVFGGVRHYKGGGQAAALYVYWKNEREAAKHLLVKADEFISVLLQNSNDSGVHRFPLQYPQRPYMDMNNPKTDPRNPEYVPELRYAHLALHTRYTYPTPEPFAKIIGENEVILFHVAELHTTFIANKWDLTFVDDNDTEAPLYTEILPARGPGERRLSVKGFSASDSRASNQLIALTERIEALSGVKATHDEYYDD